MEVVTTWVITKKLGYFTMDNAPNNDTMMERAALGICLLI